MSKIAVIGLGSLGMLLAGKLSASGHSVVVRTRTERQAEIVKRSGLTVEDGSGGAGVHAKVVAADAIASDVLLDADFVLLTVKQTALTEAFIDILVKIMPPTCQLVLFQNGIGHVERLREALPDRCLYAAVTTEGALRTGDAAVRHTGKGDTWIGRWRLPDGADAADVFDGEESHFPEKMHDLAQMLNNAGFSVHLSKQLGEAVLRKLLINAVINPLTAILRIKNGELLATPERIGLMRALFKESFDILRIYGLQDEQTLWNSVEQVCNSTRLNTSSMLQDAAAGKETEIEAINGAISRLAAAQGKEAPWNAAITALVKAIHHNRGE